MRIGKSASSAEYWTDEQFQNYQFFEPTFGFSNCKKKKFEKFLDFPIWTILKISNL